MGRPAHGSADGCRGTRPATARPVRIRLQHDQPELASVKVAPLASTGRAGQCHRPALARTSTGLLLRQRQPGAGPAARTCLHPARAVPSAAPAWRGRSRFSVMRSPSRLPGPGPSTAGRCRIRPAPSWPCRPGRHGSWPAARASCSSTGRVGSSTTSPARRSATTPVVGWLVQEVLHARSDETGRTRGAVGDEARVTDGNRATDEAHGGGFCVADTAGRIRCSSDGLDWQPVDPGVVNWLPVEPVDAADEPAPMITVERVLQDLHTLRFLGPFAAVLGVIVGSSWQSAVCSPRWRRTGAAVGLRRLRGRSTHRRAGVPRAGQAPAVRPVQPSADGHRSRRE